MTTILELKTSEADEVKDAIVGSVDENADVPISDTISLRYDYKEKARASGGATVDLLMFIVNIPTGVAINVVADQIGHYLRQKGQQRRIEKAALRTMEMTYEGGRKRSDYNEHPVNLDAP